MASFTSWMHQLHTALLPARTVNPVSKFVVRTMLQRPNRMKFRKSQKNIRAVLPRHPIEPVPVPTPTFGKYGIYATESLRVKASQLESARMSILKVVGRKGLKMWLKTFPHIPVTKKPLGVRMGSGKGAVNHFVANVRAGKIIFEFNCPKENTARMAFTQASHKLPLKVKLVIKEETSNSSSSTDVS